MNLTNADTGTDRAQTGVLGLDDVLTGGLLHGCFCLVQGDPGSGKTTLGLQFLLEGKRLGESCLYITLSETKEEIENVAKSHGWSIEGIVLLELSTIEHLLAPDAQTSVFHPFEMDLQKVSQQIYQEAKRVKARRVVFDSLSELRLMAQSSLRYRRQLLMLKQEFARLGSTVLLLDDKMDRAGVHSDPHIMSLSQGVIEMEQLSTVYGATRRKMRVFKMRAMNFRNGWHDYSIDRGGLNVFPRLIAAEHHTDFVRERVPSGIDELDSLLGGGLDRGTTTLVLGAAGTGKSSLAMQFAVNMAERGEQAIFYTFDETLGIMLSRSRALRMPLSKHIETGMLSAQQVDPAELSPGEFAVRVQRCVEKGARLVVIDSLNGYLKSMPGEQYLATQLHELASFLNQQGVITIVIMAQHGVVAGREVPLDISYLADTVLALRYFESAGMVRQALSVMKKRSGVHERNLREFRLEPGSGIRVGQPLTEFQGILGRSLMYQGGGKPTIQ